MNKKLLFSVIASLLPFVLVGTIVGGLYLFYPILFNRILTLCTTIGLSGVAILTIILTFSRKLKNWLLDRWYYDFSMLNSKIKNDPNWAKKVKIFWVDDEFKNKKSNITKLAKNLEKSYNVRIFSSIPINDSDIDEYHILIFDIEDVKQGADNQYNAREIVSRLINKNPYRVFVFCTAAFMDDYFLKNVRAMYVQKGHSVSTTIQHAVNILSDAQLFWDKCIEPYLRLNINNIKSIRKIKMAYIKDWKTLSMSRNIAQSQSNLQTLCQKKEFENLKLEELCKIIRL